MKNMTTVTLKDVARESGFSVPLVSAVVNGKADQIRISKATRQRVEEIACQMGYGLENNHSARQMAARKHGIRIANNVIAVIATAELSKSPSLHHSPYDSEILRGIDSKAFDLGFDVLICRHFGNKLPRLLERGEVDGVIPLASTPESLQQIMSSGLPIAKLISVYESDHNHNILIDNQKGMLDATRHLIELGHRQIAYIGHRIAWDVSDSTLLGASRERYAGFEQAMNEAGLPLQYVDATLAEQSMAAAGAAMDGLWERSHGKITAVVAYNDVMAMGIVRSLQKRGLHVPQDVSVIGFDDISTNLAFEPLLSSVSYDRFNLGQRAVEVLFNSRPQWLAGEKLDLVREVWPVRFVERESTAPPRAT